MAILLIIFISIAFSVAFSLIAGWMFMLAVEMAHDHWIPTLPTIGFWWAVLIMLVLRIAFISLNIGNSSSNNRRW